MIDLAQLSTQISQLELQIQSATERLEEAKEAISEYELDIDIFEDEYCNMLDENGPVIVAGMSFDASRVLKQLDSTAYQCGLADYADGKNKKDDPLFAELDEAYSEIESELHDLESDLEELNSLYEEHSEI